MLLKTIRVGDHQRVLVTRDGRFVDILKPGVHRFLTLRASIATVEFDVQKLVFDGPWVTFLVKERPDVVAEHFTAVETSDREAAVISVDGKLHSVVGPGRCVLFWKAQANITAEVIDFVSNPEVSAAMLVAVERLWQNQMVGRAVVDEGKAGLLFIDNKLVRVLAPGKYGFWTYYGSPRVDEVDLRRQSIDVAGQEILTRDKV